jgi:hypothetical protein
MFNELTESLTNMEIFNVSLNDFWRGISVSSVIMSIIVIFMLTGLIDKLRGNKHGYGERFTAGFQAMGDLALAVIGIIAVSPVLLLLLTPVVTPLYTLIGASPAMFPGSLLALDMGGYAMATQMAGDNAAVGNGTEKRGSPYFRYGGSYRNRDTAYRLFGRRADDGGYIHAFAVYGAFNQHPAGYRFVCNHLRRTVMETKSDA